MLPSSASKSASASAGSGSKTAQSQSAKGVLLHEVVMDTPNRSATSNVSLCFGQMNETPGSRMRVAFSALTVAEYLREVFLQDGLCFIDNVFRFIQAGSEVSTLLGRMPSAVGYQATLSTEMGTFQERIVATLNGSLTSIQAVYVPADDLSDPAPVVIFSHLDATTVLSRVLASKAIYPAVDPLNSTSKLLNPKLLESAHCECAHGVIKLLQRYMQLSDLLCILGLEELSAADLCVVTRARKVEKFLSQPFHVATVFTGLQGAYCNLADNIAGFSGIMAGTFDSWDESQLYMKGG